MPHIEEDDLPVVQPERTLKFAEPPQSNEPDQSAEPVETAESEGSPEPELTGPQPSVTTAKSMAQVASTHVAARKARRAAAEKLANDLPTIGKHISLASLKAGTWEEALDEEIGGVVAKATMCKMGDAEKAIQDLGEELDGLRQRLVATADKVLLLQRDAMVQAEKHFIGVAEEDQATSAEDLKIALGAYVRATFCRDHNGKRWSMLTKSKNLRMYGPGVHLYFKLTEFLLILAWVAMCSSIPQMIVNSWGTALKDSGLAYSTPVVTTAGNLGNTLSKIGTFKTVDVTYCIGWMDAAIALLFYFSAMYFKAVVMQKVNSEEAKNLATPTNFSVYVDCLPQTVGRGKDLEDVLTQHFDALLRAEVTSTGAVPGLSVVRRFIEDEDEERVGKIVRVDGDQCEVRWKDSEECEIVDLACEDSQLLDRARLQRLEVFGCATFAMDARPGLDEIPPEPVSSVHQVVLVRDFGGRFGSKENWLPEGTEVEDLPVLGAFVVFRYDIHRDFIMKEYSLSRSRVGRAMQSNSLRIEGSAVRLDDAPAPTDIFWVNMDYPYRARLFRKFLIGLCCTILLLVCAMLFAVSKNASKRAQEQQASLHCGDFGPNVTLPDLCLCSQVGYRSVLADDPPGIYARCQDWLSKVAIATSLSVGGALVSTLVNFAIGYLVEFMAKFVKPKSVTDLELSIMQMTFVFKLLALGVVVVVVNADFGFSFLGMQGIFGLIGAGEHRDMDTAWFAEVSWQVILINGFGLLNPIILVVWVWLSNAYTWWKARKMTKWKELKALYTPPQFPFSLQHAEVLSSIFVTLIFSSGMPVLTGILFVRLALECAASRYTFFNGACVPPRYTCHLMHHLASWIQCAAWFHSVLAVWTFGNSQVYPSYNWFRGHFDSVSLDITEVWEGDSLIHEWFHRAVQAAAIPNTLALVGITLSMVGQVLFAFAEGSVVRDFLQAFLEWIWRKCLRFAKPQQQFKQQAMDEMQAFERRPLKEMERKRVVHSYCPFDLLEYKERKADLNPRLHKTNTKAVSKVNQLQDSAMLKAIEEANEVMEEGDLGQVALRVSSAQRASKVWRAAKNAGAWASDDDGSPPAGSGRKSALGSGRGGASLAAVGGWDGAALVPAQRSRSSTTSQHGGAAKGAANPKRGSVLRKASAAIARPLVMGKPQVRSKRPADKE